MKEWKAGELHSGSSKGPVVKNQKQAVAIALSEQRKMHENKEPSAGHNVPESHPMLHRDSFHKNEHHG